MMYGLNFKFNGHAPEILPAQTVQSEVNAEITVVQYLRMLLYYNVPMTNIAGLKNVR